MFGYINIIQVNMNFLGHSFFKGRSPLYDIGNICGDFYKGYPDSLNLPKDMIEGIIFHRRLDSLTDSSSAVKRARKRLSSYGLFSGIIVDIFYDHFLAANWSRFCEDDLEDHSARVYSQITRNMDLIPDRSVDVIKKMIEENWFTGYRDLDFIEKTLWRVSRRISRKNNIHLSISELKEDYSFFQENFFEFWSETNNKINEL